MRLVECVPNFSEGRDPAVIDAITARIDGTEGAVLLDVDAGQATNRTVVTFVGSPEAVEEAAFRAIATAADLIDMSRHQGEHPRMGATDVCPVVPVQGVAMDECVELARRLGRRVGEQLGIPVFLYEEAALRADRRSLIDVRRGEYEGLVARPDEPDFGPREFNPRSGATAIGARQFLIAYNINLNTRDRRLANRIAGLLRETGRPRRDDAGEIVRNEDGSAVRDPGRFRHLRGVGWYIEEYGRAQLSFNLTNYKVTPLHAVFDAAREEAARLGLRVTGSELVGLVPADALLTTGDHYLTAQGRTTGVSESERIHTAVLSLGLAELGPFDPAAKVIEYRYRGSLSGLMVRRLTSFVDELASDSAAPGGGSVAALCGSLSAGLSSMVAALTHAKKGMEMERPRMEEIGVRAQILKDWFLRAVDRDTEAFQTLMAALRMPTRTEQEAEARQAAIEDTTRGATQVPLEVLENSVEALELALAVAAGGSLNAVSDAGVAGWSALAAAEAASLNVRINVGDISETTVAEEFRKVAAAHLESCRSLAARVAETVDRRMSEGSG